MSFLNYISDVFLSGTLVCLALLHTQTYADMFNTFLIYLRWRTVIQRVRESEGMLDINNELHLWALHFVCIPRINRRLTAFSNRWTQHGLRTVRLPSSLAQQRRPTTAMQDIFSSAPPRAGGEMDSTAATTEMTGRPGLPAQEGGAAGTGEGGASAGQVPSIDWNNRVEVPQSHFTLDNEHIQEL